VTAVRLAALAAALLAVIGYEVRSYQGAGTAVEPDRAPSFATSVAGEVPVGRDRSAELATIFARPLFQPDRRPVPATASAKLGRLAGIIVSGTEKVLIFAGSSGSKPIVMKEGDHVGADVVQSISDEHAALAGPDGVKVITPSFDAKGTSQAQAEATEKKPDSEKKGTAEPQSRMSRRQ
jgi:general secretion pathway protein N